MYIVLWNYTEPGPNKEPLDWNTRINIAFGVARGLEYLHHKVKPTPVIYRDLKSANILLGEGYYPKISDFGVAVFGDKTRVPSGSRLIGTFGYCAPEYAEMGKLTTKQDVFSFGVVMLELITGRRALDYLASTVCLIDWVSVTNLFT